MSSLSVATTFVGGAPGELDPRAEMMALCKRSDAVGNECKKVSDRIEQMKRRTGAFVSADALDAKVDGQAAIIVGMEDELAAAMNEACVVFVQKKNYETVQSCLTAQLRP